MDAHDDETTSSLGVSASFLRQFLAEVDKDMTTKEVCECIVAPRTKGIHAPYLKLIEGQYGEDGLPFVGEATVFVSHAWKYRISQPFEVMLDFAEEHPDAYFWFDLFVNDQNVVGNHSQEWWSSTFKTNIKRIGSVLLVLSPWANPTPLTRAWCLWEILCALELEVQFHCKLPRGERAEFEQGISRDFTAVMNTMVNVNAMHAEAFKDSDKEMIFAAIERTVGFENLNLRVKDQMRSWFLQVCKETLDMQRTTEGRIDHNMAYNVSLVFARNFSAHMQAIECLQLCLQGLESTPHLGKVAAAQVELGVAHKNLDEFDKAMLYFEGALSTCRQLQERNLIDEAEIFNHMGNTLRRMGRLDDAVVKFQESLDIRIEALGAADPSVGLAYNGFANVHTSLGNYSEAVRLATQALRIFEAAHGPDHPDCARSHMNIANAYYYQEEYQAAAPEFDKALATFVHVFGENHASTSRCVICIGNNLQMMEEYEQALTFLERGIASAKIVFGEDKADCMRAVESHKNLKEYLEQASAEKQSQEETKQPYSFLHCVCL